MSGPDQSLPVADTELEANRVALRLIVPAIATSVLVLVIGIIAALYLLAMQHQTSELLAGEVASIRAAEEMAVTVRQAEIQVHRFLVTGDSRNLEPLTELRKQSDQWLDRIEQQSRIEDELALLQELKQVQDRFWTQMGIQHDSQQADREVLYDLADDLIHSLNAYVAINNTLVQLASASNEEISQRLAISLLVLGIFGSLAGLLLGYSIARKIRRSIVQLSLSIRDTTGKLDEVLEPITISSGSEVDNLEEALQTVSAKVGTVIERLAISQREHMRAERLASLGRVSAGLAHELRNPVASMKLLIQSAMERGTSLGDRHLVVLQDEIQRLERLTKSFLDFARPPALERNRFDLVKVYEQKLLLISGKLKLKKLTIESEIPDHPLIVEADQGQMRQLLLNLFLNAIDASPEHGTIHVRIQRIDPPTDGESVRPESADDTAARRWVLIELADRGPGLPSVTMDVLFEPFFSTKQEGVGLGLPISKQIIEAHHGTIQAMNRPDGGADFRVVLPIAE